MEISLESVESHTVPHSILPNHTEGHRLNGRDALSRKAGLRLGKDSAGVGVKNLLGQSSLKYCRRRGLNRCPLAWELGTLPLDQLDLLRVMCVTYKKFCCCCCNVVTFSKGFAILGLIGGILNVIGGFLSLARTANYLFRIPNGIYLIGTFGYAGFVWVSILISVAWMIPDVFLLVGISKKKPGFMMVWLVVKMILLVVS